MDLLHTIIDSIVGIVSAWGYIGIFVMMFLESSFFPFPSEVVMIPAGYLAFQGELNVFLVILMGILGSLGGAWLNYFLALKLGRSVLLKTPIVRNFVTQEKMKKVEDFFAKHGPISTFNGRLVPVVRQYISFPAGLAKMNPLKFTFYTSAGAGIWVTILTLLGYFLGSNQELIEEYLGQITIGTLVLIVISSIVYILYVKRGKA